VIYLAHLETMQELRTRSRRAASIIVEINTCVAYPFCQISPAFPRADAKKTSGEGVWHCSSLSLAAGAARAR